MEKIKNETIEKEKDKYTLADFLSKEFIDEFIEYQNDPKYKEECEEADEELWDILGDFEDRLGREMTRYEHDTVIDILRKYSPKNKDGEIFTFLCSGTVWEIYWYEREEKWNRWEKFLR
jgi:hypothetical protein